MNWLMVNLGISGFLLASATAAQAQRQSIVKFIGDVDRACIILTGSHGVLGYSPQILSTQIDGGQAATVEVSATGVLPTIFFSSPAVSFTFPPGEDGPGYDASQLQMEIAYTSPGGANQSFTSLESSYSPSSPADIITMDARMSDPGTFPAGRFELFVTATCQN